MNLPPWRAVANRHFCVEDDSCVPGLRAVVHDHPTEYRAIWNSDQFVFLSTDTSHEQRFFNHLSYVVPYPHEVTKLKSAHVNQNSAGDRVCNC